MYQYPRPENKEEETRRCLERNVAIVLQTNDARIVRNHFQTHDYKWVKTADYVFKHGLSNSAKGLFQINKKMLINSPRWVSIIESGHRCSPESMVYFLENTSRWNINALFRTLANKPRILELFLARFSKLEVWNDLINIHCATNKYVSFVHLYIQLSPVICLDLTTLIFEFMY